MATPIPILTDDAKQFAVNGQLNIDGVNIHSSVANTGIRRELSVLNNSGIPLLVLLADGFRFVSPAGNQMNDGKCYFICKYVIGRDVEVDIGAMVREGSMDPDHVKHVNTIVEHQRRSHMSAIPDARVVEIDFHYALDCSNIDEMPNGVWIPYLGVHCYKSSKNNAARRHYGMEEYAQVCILEQKASDDIILANQTGASAVYFTQDPNAELPVYCANHLFQGVLYPTYDPNREPGVYITRFGRSSALDNQPMRRFTHIAVSEFEDNRIFTHRDTYTAHVKDYFKGKNKDKEGDALLARLFAAIDPNLVRVKTGNRLMDYDIGGAFSLAEVANAIGSIADATGKVANMFSKKR